MVARTADNVFELAESTVRDAVRRGIPLRLVGGQAIRLLCPDFPPRVGGGMDVDLASISPARDTVASFLRGRGFRANEWFNRKHGDRQLRFTASDGLTGVDVLVDRAAGRWTCRTCQSTYNYRVKPPREVGFCDLDRGELYQREDDRIDVVSERIKVYIQDTIPVVEYYRDRGILREIDGTRGIDSVATEIERQLEALV